MTEAESVSEFAPGDALWRGRGRQHLIRKVIKQIPKWESVQVITACGRTLNGYRPQGEHIRCGVCYRSR